MGHRSNGSGASLWALHVGAVEHRAEVVDRRAVALQYQDSSVLESKRTVMERVVHVAYDFESAGEWDIQQCLAMTLQERLRAARALKDRLYPQPEDVRDCLRDASKPVTFRKIRRSSSGSCTVTESAT